ncbi:MAG: 6-bladed beta-propeller [Gallionellaceae bacterium]|nr:6-bladed beta-propeller [Gallionellaceae bacterium]
MRIIKLAIFSLLSPLLLSTLAVYAETPGVSASSGSQKVNFIKEVTTGGAKKLLGYNGENFYFARKEGAIDTLDKEGHLLFTLQAKDQKGKPVLEQPEAVAVAEGTIYVVDSETNRVAMFTLEGKYKASFGTKGSDASQLRSPHGIAVHEGIVYVADSGNKRIQLYGNNGVFLTTLEIDSAPQNKTLKEKKLPYKVMEPADIAINALGQIYVLDRDDARIKVYSPDGAYLKQLSANKALAFSMSTDSIYVADKESLTIHKYDLNDKLIYSFGAKGEGRALFKSITGLAAGKDHQVLVGDSKKGVMNIFMAEAEPAIASPPKSRSRISVQWQQTIPATVGKIAWNGKDTVYGIDTDSKTILQIRNGTVAGKIKMNDLIPIALTVDKNGALWVLDKKKMRVVKLDDSGNILTSFGTRGSAVGQFDDPTDIAVSSTGTLFIADRGNSWVQAFNTEGVFLYVVRNSVSAKLINPIAIALDPHDNLYVLDKNRSMVSSYSATGLAINEFGKIPNSETPDNLVKPTALMATHDEVLVLDANQVKVYSSLGKYLRSFGAEGEGVGEFDEPEDIVSLDNTRFIISDKGNKRAQILATLHKPKAPEQLVAAGAVHAVDLRWAASPLPYVKQYQIYRAKGEHAPFTRIAASPLNQFTDQGLDAGETYYYRITSETHYGYEGASSEMVSASPQKYAPPTLDNVLVEPSLWQVKLNWKPVDSPYFRAYVIYQKNADGFTKIRETVTPEFTQDGLAPNTKYTYYISSLSTDGIESDKFPVTATTLVFNKAPLDIEVVKLMDIFSGSYKLYEKSGIGRVKLINNTDKTIEKIKVNFVLKGFMDFPTEGNIDQLLPGQSEEVNLMAVFNNSILTMTEDGSVTAMIEASYFENGQMVVYSKNPSVKVYEKHRLIWDDHGRFATFVTPKDPPIINFVRAVITQSTETKDESQSAAVLFDALGVLGVTYIPDPTNPYQVTSGKTDFVDYIQYPRETLERKSGDCDDLVAFYSAALESMGISTLVVEVPGHMFMMFATGIPADADGYTMDDMYVIHDNKLWIPVETTVVGSSFVKAWETGAANYYKWKDKGLTLLDVHNAWDTYKPASLPESALKPREVTAAEIEKRFPGEALSVLKISSQTKTRGYLQAIAKNPADMDAHLQLGIILAKVGDRKEAMKYFDKVLATQPKNAAALNNRGNLFMMDDKFQDAQKNYLAATQSNPEDPYIWVNLAKSYKVVKDTKKAKAAFVKAQKLDPSMKVKYKALALELLNTL